MTGEDDFYERYWTEKESDELFDFSYKWKAIQPLIPIKKGTTLLDFGCGAGFLLGHIQKNSPNIKSIGADFSHEGIRRAKKSLKNIQLITLKEKTKIPLPDKSVDFITCLDVIEHIYDVDLLLKEFKRIIKPNGQLLISTPYHGLIKNLIISLIAFDIVFDPTGPHIRFFTKKSLKNTLKKHNFLVKRIGFFGRFYPVWRGFYVVAEPLKTPHN